MILDPNRSARIILAIDGKITTAVLRITKGEQGAYAKLNWYSHSRGRTRKLLLTKLLETLPEV